MLRALAAAFFCFLVAGCATPQTDRLLQAPAARQGAVADAIFFAQRTKECGPAALAMTLNHAGVAVTPDALVSEVYTPGREGSLTSALVAATRRHGRVAYPINDLAAILSAIDHGQLVLVLQNLGLQWLPRWHYAVAVGYDLAAGTITLHSGTTPFMSMPLATFERTWARGAYWALVTLAPDVFPDPVNETTYLRAVAGVERAGHLEVAARAYANALARWPQNSVALMGQGNTLYALGRKEEAAAAFRLAATRLSDNADAFNNLGHVLAELGQLEAALEAARTAVHLGGPRAATYLETLRGIEAKAQAADLQALTNLISPQARRPAGS